MEVSSDYVMGSRERETEREREREREREGGREGGREGERESYHIREHLQIQPPHRAGRMMTDDSGLCEMDTTVLKQV